MKKTTPAKQTVYDRVQFILASAKDFAAHLVNTAQVVANWLIGREIVEDQQQGNKRAGYGKQLIAGLARDLKGDGVTGYGELTLHLCRTASLPPVLSELSRPARRSDFLRTA